MTNNSSFITLRLNIFLVPLAPQKHVNTNNYNRNDFAILKKGIGIESKKVCKQVRDQMVWKQV